MRVRIGAAAKAYLVFGAVLLMAVVTSACAQPNSSHAASPGTRRSADKAHVAAPLRPCTAPELKMQVNQGASRPGTNIGQLNIAVFDKSNAPCTLDSLSPVGLTGSQGASLPLTATAVGATGVPLGAGMASTLEITPKSPALFQVAYDTAGGTCQQVSGVSVSIGQGQGPVRGDAPSPITICGTSVNVSPLSAVSRAQTTTPAPKP